MPEPSSSSKHSFKAISISELLSILIKGKEMRGNVHSIFNHAVNFSFDDFLITITDIDQLNLPYGILCALKPTKINNFFLQGEPVIWNSNILRKNNETFDVDLSKAKIWQPYFHIKFGTISFAKVHTNIKWIYKYITNPDDFFINRSYVYTSNKQVLNLLFNYNPPAISKINPTSSLGQLILGLVHSEQNRIMAVIEKMIGLGIGLTPSFDDFLVGLFGALLTTAHSANLDFFKSVCEYIFIKSLGLTNDISISYFRALKDGFIAERFQNFIKDIIHSTNTKMIHLSLKNMFQFGASSGVEIVLGCLVGLIIQFSIVENNEYRFWIK